VVPRFALDFIQVSIGFKGVREVSTVKTCHLCSFPAVDTRGVFCEAHRDEWFYSPEGRRVYRLSPYDYPKSANRAETNLADFIRRVRAERTESR
jgi:hypothetical protein